MPRVWWRYAGRNSGTTRDRSTPRKKAMHDSAWTKERKRKEGYGHCSRLEWRKSRHHHWQRRKPQATPPVKANVSFIWNAWILRLHRRGGAAGITPARQLNVRAWLKTPLTVSLVQNCRPTYRNGRKMLCFSWKNMFGRGGEYLSP